MHPYLLLAIAILFEIMATIALKSTDGFSKLWPTVLVIIGYLISFTCLGFALKAGIPLNVGYAIWSGAGTVLVAVAGVLFYQERISWQGVVGIGLIVLGVLMLDLGPAHKPEATPSINQSVSATNTSSTTQ